MFAYIINYKYLNYHYYYPNKNYNFKKNHKDGEKNKYLFLIDSN